MSVRDARGADGRCAGVQPAVCRARTVLAAAAAGKRARAALPLLFLRYPPEDVRGFIENRAQNFKRAGLWKVYSDEARAEALFRKFKKCTQIYCERWQSGSKMDELAVAV